MTGGDDRRAGPSVPDGAGRGQAETAGEVLFEHRRLGAWLRVAAVDPRTGEEAVATGPADAPAMVEKLALGKLLRRVRRS